MSPTAKSDFFLFIEARWADTCTIGTACRNWTTRASSTRVWWLWTALGETHGPKVWPRSSGCTCIRRWRVLGASSTFIPSGNRIKIVFFLFLTVLETSVPNDELDLVLTTSYNHSEEQFPDQIDVYLQPETVNQTTWRKLRNLRKVEPIRTKIMSRIADDEQQEDRKPPYKYNFVINLNVQR